MDEFRTYQVWLYLALLGFTASYLIKAPRMRTPWKKIALRSFGIVLAAGLFLVSAVLAFFWSFDKPTQHIGFTSATGARFALLSHSESRDSAATRVTVNGPGCCTFYVAYSYFGEDDDYMGTNAVQWVDDHHLVIRYAIDSSETQICQSQVGDIHILCEPHPGPVFPAPTQKQ